ncbi:MAG: hypothetical protein RLZZ618_3843 [Pseudomonadota bacterium]
MKSIVTLTLLLACAGGAQAAGFQRVSVPDADGSPMAVSVWYPSDVVAQRVDMGPISIQVALEAPVRGDALPLIVVSHGSGGSSLSHQDTAAALADAGYVVAAVQHPGDNHADQRGAVQIMDRPGHIRRVIDHMLSTWGAQARIDGHRIGIFGFSAGGFTSLVNLGGVPDFEKVFPFCRQHPNHFGCALLASRRADVGELDVTQKAPSPDPRIKAAVIAAPALGFTFTPDGLKHVTVPVQLWRAENDVVLPHPWYAEAVRMALPSPPESHVVPGAGHFDFLAPCNAQFAALAPPLCATQPGFDRVAFHESFNRSVIAFFNAKLAR